jgi:hypothetical protein
VEDPGSATSCKNKIKKEFPLRPDKVPSDISQKDGGAWARPRINENEGARPETSTIINA